MTYEPIGDENDARPPEEEEKDNHLINGKPNASGGNPFNPSGKGIPDKPKTQPPAPQQQNNKWADRKNGGFDGPLCGDRSQANPASKASKVQSQLPPQSSSTNKEDEDDVDEKTAPGKSMKSGRSSKEKRNNKLSKEKGRGKDKKKDNRDKDEEKSERKKNGDKDEQESSQAGDTKQSKRDKERLEKIKEKAMKKRESEDADDIEEGGGGVKIKKTKMIRHIIMIVLAISVAIGTAGLVAYFLLINKK